MFDHTDIAIIKLLSLHGNRLYIRFDGCQKFKLLILFGILHSPLRCLRYFGISIFIDT